jgi:hypothetical protein
MEIRLVNFAGKAMDPLPLISAAPLNAILERAGVLARISHTHYDGCIIASASIAISN